MNAIKEFWAWFEINNKPYLFLNDIDEKDKEIIMDNLLSQLHKYCDRLFFEIGGHSNAPQELIITAEGDINYFKQVEDVINNAPVISNWVFIAFIPPERIDFTIDYEGIILNTNDVWFLPRHHSTDESFIGLTICVPNYDILKDHKWLKASVYKMIDGIAGEKSFALDIDYIEFDQLPNNPEEEGLIVLSELNKYVNWHKKKYPKPFQ
jgi:hypothetical protein